MSGELEQDLVCSSPFGDPDMIAKLQADSRTRPFFQDPAYALLLAKLQAEPEQFSDYMSDKRVLMTLSVLLNMKIDFGIEIGEVDSSNLSIDEEQPSTLKEQHQQAAEEEELGDEANNLQDFLTALKHFQRAAKLNPGNMVYLSKMATTYYKQKKYLSCVEQCDKAVVIGRKSEADSELIADVLTTRGNAYNKLGDLALARVSYQKALALHKTQMVLELLNDVELGIKEEDILTSTDPLKAEEYNIKGNEEFRKGMFMSALRFYTSAISYNPSSARYYCNRAACCTRLSAWLVALKDCERCLQLDDKFIQGYIRRAKIYLEIDQVNNALLAYQEVLDIDPNNLLAKHGMAACVSMHSDPQILIDMQKSLDLRTEVLSIAEMVDILKDPAMKIALKKMEEEPNVCKEHLKDPKVLNNVRKLIDCGMISNR